MYLLSYGGGGARSELIPPAGMIIITHNYYVYNNKIMAI